MTVEALVGRCRHAVPREWGTSVVPIARSAELSESISIQAALRASAVCVHCHSLALVQVHTRATASLSGPGHEVVAAGRHSRTRVARVARARRVDVTVARNEARRAHAQLRVDARGCVLRVLHADRTLPTALTRPAQLRGNSVIVEQMRRRRRVYTSICRCAREPAFRALVDIGATCTCAASGNASGLVHRAVVPTANASLVVVARGRAAVAVAEPAPALACVDGRVRIPVLLYRV